MSIKNVLVRSLIRNYTCAVVDEPNGGEYFLVGTSNSDICVFRHFPGKQSIYRASVPISTGGVHAIVATDKFIYVVCSHLIFYVEAGETDPYCS